MPAFDKFLINQLSLARPTVCYYFVPLEAIV